MRHYLRRGAKQCAAVLAGLGDTGQVRLTSGGDSNRGATFLGHNLLRPTGFSPFFLNPVGVGAFSTLPHACRLSHGRVSLCKDTRQAAWFAGGAPGWRPHTVHQLRSHTAATAAAGGRGLGAAQRPVGSSGGGEWRYSWGQYEWPVLDLRVLWGIWSRTARGGGGYRATVAPVHRGCYLM